MLKTLKDFNFNDKRVLVRCDFNEPLDENGEILNDFRIRQSLNTIKYLIKNNSKIILMSHLGDPEGQIVDSLKLDKVKVRLEKLLNVSVLKVDDCIGQEVKNTVFSLKPGQVLLLENLRFHKEEESNDLEFVKELSELGELFINDAFSVCHRAHASVVGIPKYLPGLAGLLLEREINNLKKILENPEKPLLVLIGGKKVGTKTKFIENILKTADQVIISGLIKKELLSNKITFEGQEKIISPENNLDAFDISKNDINNFEQKILEAKTIVWNGPFGKFEEKSFKEGTLSIAKAIIKSKAFSVVGGGETIEFLDQENLISKFSHVSTGGGAMLAYLSREKLPGLEVLE